MDNDEDGLHTLMVAVYMFEVRVDSLQEECGLLCPLMGQNPWRPYILVDDVQWKCISMCLLLVRCPGNQYWGPLELGSKPEGCSDGSALID